jgi:hypothetical protein
VFDYIFLYLEATRRSRGTMAIGDTTMSGKNKHDTDTAAANVPNTVDIPIVHASEIIQKILVHKLKTVVVFIPSRLTAGNNSLSLALTSTCDYVNDNRVGGR